MKFSEINEKIHELVSKLKTLETNLKNTNDNVDYINNSTKYTINVKYPPKGLPACKIDGVTDDTDNLKTILESDLAKNCKIIIPQGTMILNKGNINIYTDRINIENHAKIKSKLTDNNSILFNFLQKDSEIYSKKSCIIEGLLCDSNNNMGTLFNFGGDTSVCRDVTFKNCSCTSFNKHIIINNNAYLINFENCNFTFGARFIDCLGDINCGENIKFTNCCLCNALNEHGVIYSENPTLDLYFNNCSIDYNVGKIIKLYKGNIFLNNCHIEHRLKEMTSTPFEIIGDWYYRHIYINNSYIIFTDDDNVNKLYPEYIFKTNKIDNSAIIVNGCTLQNVTTSSDYLSNGDVILKDLIIEPLNTCPNYLNKKNNLVYDGEMFDHSLTTHNDIKNSGGITLSFTDNNWLRINKDTDGNHYIHFLIKRHNFNANNHFIKFKYQSENVGSTFGVSIYLAKGLFDEYTITKPNNIYSKNIQISNNSDNEIVCKVENFQPSSDYIIIQFKFIQDSFPTTNWLKIRNVYVDEV